MTILSDLTAPKRLAIVGASDNPTRIGGRPMSYMLKPEFKGICYPVNPNRETIQGVTSYPSLRALPDDIDFAIIAVPAAQVAGQVRDAAEKGAKAALIFSSGFAEMGEEGAALQDELYLVGKNNNIRIIGPNCLGLFNASEHFYATFTSSIDRATPRPGGLAIASQSGAYGSHIYMSCHERGLGIGQWVTTGNEVDIEVAEVIKMYAAEESVHTILAYVESIKNGPLMIEALEAARANKKPVVITKVGRSEVGAAAASSHTASLAGEDAIYDAIFKQYGAYRVQSTEEMIDVAVAARPRIYPVGKKVGLVTISGGAGILMADAASDLSLDVAPMPIDAQEEMKKVLPFAAPRNPVDVTAQFFNDLSLIPKFTKAMLDRGGYDGLVGFWTSVAGSPLLGKPLLEYLKHTMKDYPDRLFLHVMLAPQEMCEAYEKEGFPTFTDPTRALAALKAMMHFGMSFADKADVNEIALPTSVTLPNASTEQQAKAILQHFGLSMVQDELASTADAVMNVVEKHSSEMVMKISSPDILHKSDVGGVVLHLKTAQEAAIAFEDMMASVKKLEPNAQIDGVLLTPMVEEGVDMILGARIDPIFGPLVMIGMGGVHAEIFKDVAFMRAPVSAAQARSMVDSLKLRALLDGPRGAAVSDVNALVDAIVKMSVFAASHEQQLDSAEINPLRVLPNGCVGLDALIQIREVV